MRDLVFTIFLIYMLALCFRSSAVPLSLWAWASLFNPIGWLFGFASSMRFVMLFAATTFLSYFMDTKRAVYKTNILFWTISFFLLTTISTIYTINHEAIAWELWDRFFKVVILFVFVQLIINDKEKIDLLLTAIVFGVAVWAVVEAPKFILSLGKHRIAGHQEHVFGDRNSLAMALNMLIPILVYFIHKEPDKWRKLIYKGFVVATVVAILGTFSRGGFIGLTLNMLFLTMASKQKFKLIFLFGVMAVVFVFAMPEEWFSRMNTIESADQDSSFMGRVHAWAISVLIALESPLIGGGFRAVQNLYIWDLHKQYYSYYEFIASIPDYGFAKAAHSIYFEVIGDHGFLGAFLYGMIFWTSYRTCNQIMKLMTSETWQFKLARALKQSLIIFLVVGAALSVAYIDLIFLVIGLISALYGTVMYQLKQDAKEGIKKKENAVV